LRDESIMIGDDIEVKVSEIRGDRVRLGISAPQDVKVHRKEIYDRIRQENQDAAQLPGDSIGPVTSTAATHEGMTIFPAPRDPFLVAAITAAKRAMDEGGLPIGAVMVRGTQIIGTGSDRRAQSGDPTAVAEMECLRSGGQQSTYRDVTLYTTLFSGALAAGAIRQLDIRKVMVGDRAIATPLLPLPGTVVIELRDREVAEMLSTFIHEHRELWDRYYPK
jgi:cytosine deaminase